MIRNIFITLFCLAGCNNSIIHTNTQSNVELRGIKVTQFFPNLTNKGKLEGYDTVHTEIYYYKDLVLDKLSYDAYQFTDTGSQYIETRYHYLVYTIGYSTGIDFDVQRHPLGEKTSLDSTFELEWAFNTNIDRLFTLPGITLAKTENTNSTVHEMYTFKGGDDLTKTGTIDLYFNDQLKDIPYSLAKGLDSSRNKKLFKTRVFNNKRYMKEHEVYIDELVSQAYTLEEITAINMDEIMGYFKKYAAFMERQKN